MDDSWVTDDNNNSNFQFSVLGVFALFPSWPIPNTIIDSFTTQRARLTPCPLRKCKHPEGNCQRLVFTYLQAREQGWHLAHLGSINHPKVISKHKHCIDFFTIHRARLTPCPLRKCKQPEGNPIRLLLTSLHSIGQGWHLILLGSVLIQM